MQERLTAIFATVSAGEMSTVAASVLGVTEVRVETTSFQEINKPHADGRTIGIVRVSGAASVAGQSRPWSCVTKIIDLNAELIIGTPVDPRNEVLVYERGYFAGGDAGLRPAKCHHISRKSEKVTILWLEDLTDASAPPFDVEVMAEMARHLGKWNASVARNPPQVDFQLGRDFQVVSWKGFNFAARMTELIERRDEPMVRELYSRQTIEVAGEFVAALGDLVERSKALPHAMSLADCPVSNFFHRPGETIAIDWAGLGSEPVGADGGRFIGSALTWGKNFAQIAVRERDLFANYLAGHWEGGSVEEAAVLRSGYLSELAFYICTLVVMPTILLGPRAALSIEFFERRFEMPVAEISGAAAPVMELLPSYTQEIRALLA